MHAHRRCFSRCRRRRLDVRRSRSGRVHGACPRNSRRGFDRRRWRSAGSPHCQNLVRGLGAGGVVHDHCPEGRVRPMVRARRSHRGPRVSRKRRRPRSGSSAAAWIESPGVSERWILTAIRCQHLHFLKSRCGSSCDAHRPVWRSPSSAVAMSCSKRRLATRLPSCSTSGSVSPRHRRPNQRRCADRMFRVHRVHASFISMPALAPHSTPRHGTDAPSCRSLGSRRA